MYIYNVTVKITWQIHDAWFQWMIDLHVPEILGTGCFVKHQVLKILETDEQEGPTYAFQYYAESKANYNAYMELYKPVLTKQIMQQWGDQYLSFSTLMEVMH